MKNSDPWVFAKLKSRAAKKKFLVPSDLSEVQKVSLRVLSFLKPLGLSEAREFDIRLCLEEALINAMKYGNHLRSDLAVDLDVEFDEREVRITVEDRGPGFDVKKLDDCTSGENVLRNRGRGVYLIQKLMDQVRYNDKGNRLLMVKSLGNHKQKR
jgi:serine/threonine-protein kinase RsbW